MGFSAFGDSITVGYGVPADQGWLALLTPKNCARSGDQAADMSKIIHGLNYPSPAVPVAIDPARSYSLMIGANDHRTYRGNAAQKEYFKRFLRAAITWLVMPGKLKARDSDVVLTGPWSNSAMDTFGKQSTSNGAKLAGMVSGTSVYIAYTLQNYANTESQVEVRIDGVLVDTLTCNGQSPSINTVNGANYSTAAVRYAGLTSGPHAVELSLVSPNGKYFYFGYMCGNDQPASPKVLVSNIIKMSSAAYASHSTSQAIVDSYNQIISDLVNEFVADGFRVALVDNHAAIDPASHLQPDGVHPNRAGFAVIAQNFKQALDG